MEDPERTDIARLLDSVYEQRGLDYREYAYASLRRRVLRRVDRERVAGIPALRERVLKDSRAMEGLLYDLSVATTAMFRDPAFFLALRTEVVPFLKTYPFVRIWDVGCSTGEELYSLAILLHEEGLADRTRIYATDSNDGLVQKAKEGIFPLEKMKAYTQNYMRAGGRGSFSSYYSAKYDAARFDPPLVSRTVFAVHNLVTDASFNEFQLILCRNVMIYFNRELQSRVHKLLYESLARLGMLGLGERESIRFSPHEGCYEPVQSQVRLYRKVR